MKQTFNEPIQKRAISLFLIYLIFLLITTAAFYVFGTSTVAYRNRLANQRARQDLGETILGKITTLENEFGRLSAAKDMRDLEVLQKQVNDQVRDIQQILYVLQFGGTFTQNIPININNAANIEMSITYAPKPSQGYFVEALELLPLVLDIEEIAGKLNAAVQESLQASAVEEENAADWKLDLLKKQADTFFIRARENANRIYYESRLEMQTVAAEEDSFISAMRFVTFIIILGVALAGGSMSIRTLRQIAALLKARNEAENLLRQAELHYRTVADFTYDWEYWRNPDGSLEYVSPACKRITGYTAEEISAAPRLLDEMVHPEDSHIWENHAENNKQGPRSEIRFRIRRKDGKTIWVEHTCQPVTTPGGDFIGYRGSNRDVTENVKTQDDLHRSNLEIETAYETTLEGWARALELRDYETKGHAQRVVSLTLRLAQEMGIQGEELTHIRRGALLHDIGKIAVPDSILLKPGPCSPKEWEIIRKHPQYGYDMLKEIDYLKHSLDIVLYHHEKWDGNGYPRGLAGKQIPLPARIFSIVDVWDALINDRPYHKAWEAEKILQYIEAQKGQHFDPQVVEAFLRIMK